MKKLRLVSHGVLQTEASSCNVKLCTIPHLRLQNKNSKRTSLNTFLAYEEYDKMPKEIRYDGRNFLSMKK